MAPAHSGDTEQVVFGTSGDARLTDAAIGQRINAMVDEIKALPNVSLVNSPYDSTGDLVDTTNINADRTVGWLQVNFDKQSNAISNAEAKDFVHVVTHTSTDGLTVSDTGPLAENANGTSIGSSGLGILLALVVLLLVFGSAFAALLPILSALFALGTAVGIIGLRQPRHRHAVDLARADPADRIGRGCRLRAVHRDPPPTGPRRRSGLEASIVNAVNTSGRAVLFAGIIVCIALLGMFALGVSFLSGLAVAAAIGVALTMLAALTLLPAMLGFIGPKVMSRKQKRTLAESGPRIVGADSKGFWPRWADRVQRRPVVSAVAGAGRHRGVHAALLLPPVGLRGPGHRPGGTPTRVGLRHALRRDSDPGSTAHSCSSASVQPDQTRP